MISAMVIDQIRSCVGARWFLDDPNDRAAYSFDAFCMDFQPDAVVLPRTTEEVSTVLAIADREKVSIIPRGAGTNLSGTAVARRGGIIMSLARMNRIVEIDPGNRCAIVQPGVVNADLQKALLPFGLMYGPDPSSWYASTIGGNIALNAAGPRAVKYGSTRDHLLGLQVVLASGEIMRTGAKTFKNAAGYDLTRLFCGSEGTLGVITEAIVRLIPMPEAKRTLQVIFSDLGPAGHAVSEIMGSGIVPSALDLLDKILIDLIQGYGDVKFPEGASVLLLIEVDGFGEALPSQVDKIAGICRKHGAIDIQIATTDAENEIIWRARRSIGGTFSKVCRTLINEDATVPVKSLPEFITTMVRLRDKYRLRIGMMAHAGDGNLHPSIMTNAADCEEMGRVEAYARELYKAAIALGGSISGEHGIGLAKKAFVKMQFDPAALGVMGRIKRTLDPNNILNPGSYVDDIEDSN